MNAENVIPMHINILKYIISVVTPFLGDYNADSRTIQTSGVACSNQHWTEGTDGRGQTGVAGQRYISEADLGFCERAGGG